MKIRLPVKFKRKKNAFTLVEILVILAILGVLFISAFLVIPTQIAKARDAVRKSSIDYMRKKIEEYYDFNDCYPQAIPACKSSLVSGSVTLIDSIPCDPQNNLSFVYVGEISDCPSWYQLYGNLEYTKDDVIDKIGCREGCGPDCEYNYGVSSSNQKLDPYCIPVEPPPPPAQYVCAPGGECEIFADPLLSGCPDVYENDPTCQNKCTQREYRCHDARGKTN